MENKKVTNLAKKSQSRGSGHGMTRSALIKMRSFENKDNILEYILQLIKEQTGKDIKATYPEDYSDGYQYMSMFGFSGFYLYNVTTLPSFFKAIETKYSIHRDTTKGQFYLPDGRLIRKAPTVKAIVDFVFNNQRQGSNQSIQTRL